MRSWSHERARISVWGSLLVLFGCGPPWGTFTETGYRHGEYPFEVRYAGGSPSSILGPDWIVENHQYAGGAPTTHKVGPRYTVEREYDIDDDGHADLKVDEPAWDLRLENRREDAVIWLESMPMASKDRDKSLSILARRVLDSMSGAETVAVEDRTATMVSSSERRAAVHSVAAIPCTLSEREAWLVEFDVANVDALAISPGSRWRRFRLVMVRSGYDHHPRGSSQGFPVVLVAGHANAPETFAAHTADFDHFLSQIVLAKDEPIPASAPPHSCRVASLKPAPDAVPPGSGEPPVPTAAPAGGE